MPEGTVRPPRRPEDPAASVRRPALHVEVAAGQFLSDTDDHWTPAEIEAWVKEGSSGPRSPLALSRALQARLGEVRGVDASKAAKTPEELTARLRMNIEAMHVELAEMLMELPWKEWKTYSDKFLDGERVAAIKEEAIDLYFFLNNMFLALGVTEAELQLLYERKFNKNMARQAEGGAYR